MKKDGGRTKRSSRERPINKRPGRVVCICTAKGKIVYCEDQMAFNKRKKE